MASVINDNVQLTRAFATTRYIDFDRVGGTQNGLTPATAWNSFAQAIAAEWTPILSTNTLFDQLWVVAGTSRGLDAADMSCFAQRRPAGGVSNIGIRGWRASDGTRPSSNTQYTRPLLRMDVAFTSLTQVGVTTVYKSNAITAPAAGRISQCLYKPGDSTNLDAYGMWKSHMFITGQAAGVADATIAANLVAAGANTAYYKTDTREIFVNTAGSLSTTASDWAYCDSKLVENSSKIRLEGFDYAGVEGVDTAWGERGIVIFDAFACEIYRCRAYEHQVHGIICSYSNFPLQNIKISNCEIFGGGQSTTGNTMLAVAGGAANNDMKNVYVSNIYIARYMLVNPSGTKYYMSGGVAADYPLFFVAVGTAQAATGKVTQCLVSNCSFNDVLPTTTSISQASPIFLYRCADAGDLTNPNTYPVIFRNCTFNMYGITFFFQGNADSWVWAFDSCVWQQKCDVLNGGAAIWGYRAAVLFDNPASGGKYQMGLFNSEWRMDYGVGQSGQVCYGFGIKSDGAIGVPNTVTARNSKIFVVSSHSNVNAVFDQSADSTAGGVNKGNKYDISKCVIGVIQPIGTNVETNANMVIFQDLPATGNAARVFSNNRYFNISRGNYSTANASLANWIANVDPLSQPDLNVENVGPIYYGQGTIGASGAGGGGINGNRMGISL